MYAESATVGLHFLIPKQFLCLRLNNGVVLVVQKEGIKSLNTHFRLL